MENEKVEQSKKKKFSKGNILIAVSVIALVSAMVFTYDKFYGDNEDDWEYTIINNFDEELTELKFTKTGLMQKKEITVITSNGEYTYGIDDVTFAVTDGKSYATIYEGVEKDTDISAYPMVDVYINEEDAKKYSEAYEDTFGSLVELY